MLPEFFKVWEIYSNPSAPRFVTSRSLLRLRCLFALNLGKCGFAMMKNVES